ncbi:MAG: hypothetical protein ACJASL_002329 [Paraglaciecola sp.]|jgi:hypothetical protein
MNLSKLLPSFRNSSFMSTTIQSEPKSQFKYLRQSAITIFTLSLAACGGGGADTPVSAPEASVNVPVSSTAPILLQKETVVLPGEQCATGGIELASAVDLNNDGFLDASEIDTSEIVCDGKDGLDGITALVAQNVVAPGDSCENGGLRFDVGLDIDDNGVLDASEANSTEFLCTVVIDTAGFEAPSVVSAISISNTEIMLQFSEPMLEIDISNWLNYSITNAGTDTSIPVWGALIANEDNSTVLLTTSSQSSVRYLITAINVRDADGNPITKPTIADSSILSSPSSTTFVGTDPSGNVIADSDGDTLPDHTELNGWDITVTYGNGTTESRRVTSDPGDPNQAIDSAVNIAARDTDNDGVTDNEERHGGIDPRQPDTDGDTLTDNQEWNIIYSDPSHQDTDGDGTQDGFEFYSYRTSPILADTDGDQISDTDEVLARNRDPRIADLPLYNIKIGDLRLQIDERYTYEDVDGRTIVNESSSSVTMSLSNSSSERMDYSGYAEALLDVKKGVSEAKPVALVQGTFKVGAAIAISSEDATESQRVSEQSLNKSSEFSTTSTVIREVVGARIDAGVSIENRGDLAFAITNLEVTVLQRSRASTRRFIPVATLIANSTLISGEPATFNLGPFTTERGPILFSSRDVFPNLVDALMQLPPGALVFEVVNFDVVDEFGRQFTFSNQSARDRTASVIVDTGDENMQRYLVATALQPDPDGFGGAAGDFVGGFNGDGSPKGISLDFALQDILELTKNPTAKDGIVAGINQTADSVASGDDVQLIPPGTTGVSVGSIVISAGQDGILESAVSSDDEAEVTTGYETSLICNVASDNAGQACSVDSGCTGNNAACNGPETLVRFGSQRNGDYGRQWVVLTTETVRAGADFGRITLKPRQDIYLAFVQDLDQDGIFAREEFLSGSTDSSADKFDNSSFGEGSGYVQVFDNAPTLSKMIGFAIRAPVAAPDGIADSKDTDRDGLGDFAEIRVGWKVSADGGLLQQVYSSPRLADSDGDGMLDPQEQDLSDFCRADGDPRQDALCRFQIEEVVTQANAISIVAGADGIAASIADGDDEQRILQSTSSLTVNTVVIGPGINGFMDTPLSGDDQYQSSQSSSRVTPSSNPLLADTDADGISDFAELNGYLVGMSIRDGVSVDGDDSLVFTDGGGYVTCGPNDIVDTALGGDDYYTQVHSYGSICDGSTGDTAVIFSGSNGIVDSIPNQQPKNTRDDSVADTLAVGDDIQQAFLGGNVFSGGIVVLPGPNATIESIPQGDDVYVPGEVVVTDPLRRDTDSDLVADGRERDQGGDPTDVFDGEQFRDSDQDGLSDTEESMLGWMVMNEVSRYLVLSNPSRPDSDYDGLPDLAERILGTDPNKADTDGDGLSDFDEVADFEQFFGLDEQHPGFFVDGANSMQYGTSPNKADTDDDGLPDYFELLVGYRLVVPGESVPRQIYTNPLDRDTDADFLSDLSEYGLSDATVIDTDEDGRGDALEQATGTNPLVPDVNVSINADRIVINTINDDGGDGGAEFVWFITTQKSGSDPVLLSSAMPYARQEGFDENFNIIGTPYSWGRLNDACDMIFNIPLGANNTHTFVLNHQSNHTLKEGETITVRGVLAEVDSASDDCGTAPNYIPSYIEGGCTSSFSQTFGFEDFENGGQASFPFPSGAGTAEACDWTLEIDAKGQ